MSKLDEQQRRGRSDGAVLAALMNNAPFHDLDPVTRGEVLSAIVDADARMRAVGQERPVWDGDRPEAEVLGRLVAARTDHGEIVGKAVYFGKREDVDGRFVRTVVVHVPSSGSVHQVPGRCVRLAGEEESARAATEMVFAGRLRKAEAALTPRAKVAAREEVELFVRELVAMARRAGLDVDEKAGFWKIIGRGVGARNVAYVAKDGRRADLSGFSVAHLACLQLTEEQARDRHLGRVRGQIDMSDRDLGTAAWIEALVVLTEGASPR